MARKFLIVIVVVAVVMTALAIIPGLTNPGPLIALEYSKKMLVRINGEYDTNGTETLRIEEDGSAQYRRIDSEGHQVAAGTFKVDAEELKVLRELFLGTGFMQIPTPDYLPKPGLSNYTSYHLDVKSGGQDKSIDWVNPEAGAQPIPSIVVNTGTRLDNIISRHS